MLQAGVLDVRPFSSPTEYEGMIDYVLQGEDDFLRGMGVDRSRLPSRESWLREVLADHERPDEKKDRLYLAWIRDGCQIGHSSVNRIKVGEEAYFHLNLWRADLRKAGLGVELCRRSIALYFGRLRLERLWCEPFAHNPAPNRTLPKLGFNFVRRYRTVPGPIHFEQEVNLYRLDFFTAEARSRGGMQVSKDVH